ncbi:COMM domain-containing protein 5-like isoform X2 [Diachasmimorpha longicaudata]|uniref:COMM domain-containing protein 5-like isoform X2 n=1 Tax=Diachasmimorpha longicaudata TaxID=58733 RepID=UPI0030B8E4A4
MSSDTAICLTTTLGSKGKHISEIKKTILRPLIQLAVKAIEQEHIEDGILDRLSEKYNLPPEKVDEWYSTVLTIFKAHLRSANSPMKTADFKECLQELKFENSCIDDLCAVLYGHKRPALIHALTEKTKFFPMLKACRWRIDVTISSSSHFRMFQLSVSSLGTHNFDGVDIEFRTAIYV